VPSSCAKIVAALRHLPTGLPLTAPPDRSHFGRLGEGRWRVHPTGPMVLLIRLPGRHQRAAGTAPLATTAAAAAVRSQKSRRL